MDYAEFDVQVLGGGFVAGSVNLMAGQPGIGKSTLLLQVACGIAKNAKVIYVSGEESAHQAGPAGNTTSVLIIRISELPRARQRMILLPRPFAEANVQVVIVDSIQTTSCNELKL